MVNTLTFLCHVTSSVRAGEADPFTYFVNHLHTATVFVWSAMLHQHTSNKTVCSTCITRQYYYY